VVYEGAFDYLDAPIVRLGAMDVPVPFSKPLEDATIPNEQGVVDSVMEMMA
jgi:pyruvate dehydrogenase E1 component beta subunit